MDSEEGIEKGRNEIEGREMGNLGNLSEVRAGRKRLG